MLSCSYCGYIIPTIPLSLVARHSYTKQHRWLSTRLEIQSSLFRETTAKMSRTDLSPVTLLQQEIQTLTSSMRRNQRWASTSTSSFQSSSSPLPPAFHPKNGKRSREGSVGSRRGRQSGEGVEEGDLMLGFIELRRTLSGVKGECRPLIASCSIEQ